jgi:hypothetical protein
MAKTKKTQKDFDALKQRLSKGTTTKADISYLHELIGHAADFSKALASSKQKIGSKTIISKLPFGLDLVK